MPVPVFGERVAYSDAFSLNAGAVVNTFQSFGGLLGYDREIDVWQMMNTDSIDHHVAVDWINGDGSAQAGDVLVPAGAGNGTVPPVDAIAALMPTSVHYLIALSGFPLAVAIREAIGASAVVRMVLLGGTV